MWKPSVESNTRHKSCIVYLMTLWNNDHVDIHGNLKSTSFVFCLCFICSSIFSCYHWILSSFIIHQTNLLCMKSICEMIECIVLWNAVWWVAELVWCGWCIWIGHEFRVQREGNFCYAMYDLIILCIKLIIVKILTVYLSKEFSF